MLQARVYIAPTGNLFEGFEGDYFSSLINIIYYHINNQANQLLSPPYQLTPTPHLISSNYTNLFLLPLSLDHGVGYGVDDRMG